MYYVIWTDGIGGSFAQYCNNQEQLIKFLKTKDDDKIKAITKPI